MATITFDKTAIVKALSEGGALNASVEGGNDWKIVFKKFAYGLIAAAIPVWIPFMITFLQTEDLSGLPAWFVASVPFIVGILLAIQNAWNHRQKVVIS